MLRGRRAVEREQFEAMDEDAGGFDVDRLAGAGEFVGGDAADFLCGEDGRHLLHFAVEAGGEGAQFFEGVGERLRFGGGRALGVEGVGGEAEADGAFVVFFGGARRTGRGGCTCRAAAGARRWPWGRACRGGRWSVRRWRGGRCRRRRARSSPRVYRGPVVHSQQYLHLSGNSVHLGDCIAADCLRTAMRAAFVTVGSLCSRWRAV